MGRARDILSGLGFIITAVLLTSNVMPEHFTAVRTQSTEIFFTNCKIIINRQPVWIWDYLELPQRCSTIFTLLQASLISVGVLLVLLGATKWVCIFSILNLTVLSCYYSNPLIDSSFKTYSLFLLIVVAIAAFAARIFRDDNEGENEKIHRE